MWYIETGESAADGFTNLQEKQTWFVQSRS